jgi:hypothetical protein
MVRPLAAFVLVLLPAGPLLVAQNPPPAPNPPAGNPPAGNPPPPAPAPGKGDEKKPDPPAPPAPIVDDVGNAAKVAQQYEKQLADKDAQKRSDALAVFAIHRSESYVKLLAPLLHDKDEKVATAAVAALGNQPFPASTDVLLNYVGDDKKGAPSDELRVAAINALGDVGLGKHGYERLRENFETRDDDDKVAIVATFVKLKEKRAFSFLVDHVDEPKFTGANRPPTAVIKKAVDGWNKYQGMLRKGLRDMTGEGFPSAKQYIDWAATPAARKAGFAYERGK